MRPGRRDGANSGTMNRADLHSHRRCETWPASIGPPPDPMVVSRDGSVVIHSIVRTRRRVVCGGEEALLRLPAWRSPAWVGRQPLSICFLGELRSGHLGEQRGEVTAVAQDQIAELGFARQAPG
jgi:hypothetical protein